MHCEQISLNHSACCFSGRLSFSILISPVFEQLQIVCVTLCFSLCDEWKPLIKSSKKKENKQNKSKLRNGISLDPYGSENSSGKEFYKLNNEYALYRVSLYQQPATQSLPLPSPSAKVIVSVAMRHFPACLLTGVYA